MASAVMFDPGVSTGIEYWTYDDNHHAEPLLTWQVEGGTAGLDAWIDNNWEVVRFATVIGSEKFVPHAIENGSHTLESTYPLVQEGLLIGRRIMPHYPEGNWQPAANQYFVGGKTAEIRKRRMDDKLKARGLWMTGKGVGLPDANDALSARRQMLFLLTRTIRHQPTIEWFYGEESAP